MYLNHTFYIFYKNSKVKLSKIFSKFFFHLWVIVMIYAYDLLGANYEVDI